MSNSRIKPIALLLMMCLVTFNSAWASVNATLRGRVVDAKTGEALMGATLQILQVGKLP